MSSELWAFFFFFLMIRRPPRSTLFPYPAALPISQVTLLIDLRAQRRRRCVPARCAGADEPQVIEVGAAEGAHEEVIGERVFARPLPEFHARRSEEHTSELQSQSNLVCRLLLEKKK